MFIKIDNAKILAAFDFEKSGITLEMIKCRGKYVEVAVKEVKEKDIYAAKKDSKQTKVTIVPDFKGLVLNSRKPHGQFTGHTLLMIINPLIARQANIPSQYLLEEEDVDKFGDWKITFILQAEGRKLTTEDWFYRFYSLN